MHHTHTPTHAWPTLPVIPDPNPTPANQYRMGLHYAATIILPFFLSFFLSFSLSFLSFFLSFFLPSSLFNYFCLHMSAILFFKLAENIFSWKFPPSLKKETKEKRKKKKEKRKKKKKEKRKQLTCNVFHIEIFTLMK